METNDFLKFGMQIQAKQAPISPAPTSPTQDVQTVHAVISAEQMLQLQAALLGRKRFNEAATALAQQLNSCLKCDRTSIGGRKKDDVSIVAASYVAEIHARQETARLIAAAAQ